LQAITKARVCFGLIRFAVDGNRHVAVDHFERPLRRHVLHLIAPAPGQMAKAADRSGFNKHMLNKVTPAGNLWVTGIRVQVDKGRELACFFY
jgi:hypothetical protein